MRKFILTILFLTILTSCFQNRNQSHETIKDLKTEPLIKNDTLLMFQGVWINHDKSGFTILDLKDFQNVKYYHYTNREVVISEIEPKNKHFFYTSKGKIEYCGSNKLFQAIQLSIKTDKYRFFYILKGDTLFLWMESGLEEPLIRMESDTSDSFR